VSVAKDQTREKQETAEMKSRDDLVKKSKIGGVPLLVAYRYALKWRVV
jgi:hypothetical protein